MKLVALQAPTGMCFSTAYATTGNTASFFCPIHALLPGESTGQILADVGRVVGKDAKTTHRNFRLFIETDRPYDISGLRCVQLGTDKGGPQSA